MIDEIDPQLDPKLTPEMQEMFTLLESAGVNNNVLSFIKSNTKAAIYIRSLLTARNLDLRAYFRDNNLKILKQLPEIKITDEGNLWYKHQNIPDYKEIKFKSGYRIPGGRKKDDPIEIDTYEYIEKENDGAKVSTINVSFFDDEYRNKYEGTIAETIYDSKNRPMENTKASWYDKESKEVSIPDKELELSQFSYSPYSPIPFYVSEKDENGEYIIHRKNFSQDPKYEFILTGEEKQFEDQIVDAVKKSKIPGFDQVKQVLDRALKKVKDFFQNSME